MEPQTLVLRARAGLQKMRMPYVWVGILPGFFVSFVHMARRLADMLVHSPLPAVPLIVVHVDKDRIITAEDEKRIILALRHPARARRIQFVF